MTATPLDVSDLLTNPKIGAILLVGQPSVTVLGVGEIIYGDKAPAGRTIQTIYKSSYQDQISIFDFNMRPGPSAFARPDCTNHDVSKCPRGTNPGRTYRFYTGKPVVPFGYGLSYASFKYTSISLPGKVSLAPLAALLDGTQHAGFTFPREEHSQQLMKMSDWKAEMQFGVNVTNTGARDSDDVVLGFFTPPGAG